MNNFKKYLLDEKSNIDYTYLWDVITTNKLFNGGLNLIIMEIINNDITDKVDILCPLTTYVKNRFDEHRDTIFLIKQGTIYEPVYMKTKTKTKSKQDIVVVAFNFQMPYIEQLLENLNQTLNNYCSENKKNEYLFKSPMDLLLLIDEIGKTTGYSIKKQVLNYQHRIIALLINTPSNNNIVVPCEPSEKQEPYESVYMDDDIWSDYETTIKELHELKDKNPQILCKPVVKIYEDELIVGFLTETNQFIKLDGKPKNNVQQEKDSKYIVSNVNNILNSKQNPYEIELKLSTSKNTSDPERIRVVRSIILESNFFRCIVLQ